MITIAIVEDIPELREAMISMIRLEKDLLCIYNFGNAEDALTTLTGDPVDVVLMDIHLPGMSGTECVLELKQRHPGMQFIISTIFQDDENIFSALKAGASGYLLKGDEPARILEAIKDVHNGGSPMNSQIARKVIASFHGKIAEPSANEKAGALLTPREHELLRMLAKGLRYKEIASELSISVETVRKHINNIYTKLQVQSRIEAVNKVYPR
jgi:DNA-binding NarL/FixJ family response regulator